MEALDLWAASRAYPEKVIPDIGHALAYAYSRSFLANSGAEARSLDAWSPIGPHNIGGRTLAVLQDPQNPSILWAGSASGGLWKSTTGGVGPDAWDPVETGFPVLGVSSIVISPDDPDVMYIGTGEVYGYQSALGGLAVRLTRGSYGIGILKSVDGGQTWTHSLDWSKNQRRGVASLAMHPQDPNTIYAGTTEGTYKTTDGGNTWNLVHSVLMSMQVVIDPTTPSRVYAACGDLGSAGTGIYRSNDGGQNWVQLTAGLPGSWNGKAMLDIYRASANVIYASIAQSQSGRGLYRSVDFGNSWVQLSSENYPGVQGFYSHWVHVSPRDSSIVLVGGVDIWRSTQGGRNLATVSFWYLWYLGSVPPGGPEGPSNYAHADHHAVWADPQRPDTLYFATDGGVFRSFDEGLTFAGVNGGYQTSQFYNGFTNSALSTNLAIGGMQDNATAIFEGTVGWRRVIGGDGCWTAIHPVTQSTMYAETQFLNLQRSTDSGASWAQITSGITVGGPAAFVAPFLLSPSSPSIMYAGNTIVYRSTNGGSSWSATNGGAALDGNPALSMAISTTDPNLVYVGTAPVSSRARVFATTNGGTSWLNMTGNLPDRYPVDVAVDPSNGLIVYAVLSGFGSGHIFRTANLQSTWADLTVNLPDVPTSAIAIDPDYPNILYVGNDLGVYVSQNGGATWEEFKTGMPSAAIVMDLAIVRGNRRLRAVTHGCGVFERALLEPVVAVDEGKHPATRALAILGAAPNPFQSTTELRFHLARPLTVTVTVHDVAGRTLARLVSGERRGAGDHAIRVDARPLGLRAGVYVARVAAGGESEARRIVVTE